MVAPIIACGVVIAWIVVIVLVHHDKGWVGVTDFRRSMLRLTRGFALMQAALAEELLPGLRKLTKAVVALNAALERDPPDEGAPVIYSRWRCPVCGRKRSWLGTRVCPEHRKVGRA